MTALLRSPQSTSHAPSPLSLSLCLSRGGLSVSPSVPLFHHVSYRSSEYHLPVCSDAELLRTAALRHKARDYGLSCLSPSRAIGDFTRPRNAAAANPTTACQACGAVLSLAPLAPDRSCYTQAAAAVLAATELWRLGKGAAQQKAGDHAVAGQQQRTPPVRLHRQHAFAWLKPLAVPAVTLSVAAAAPYLGTAGCMSQGPAECTTTTESRMPDMGGEGPVFFFFL